MEVIIALVLIGFALYLIYLLLVYVIMPIASVAGIITIVIEASELVIALRV